MDQVIARTINNVSDEELYLEIKRFNSTHSTHKCYVGPSIDNKFTLKYITNGKPSLYYFKSIEEAAHWLHIKCIEEIS